MKKKILLWALILFSIVPVISKAQNIFEFKEFYRDFQNLNNSQNQTITNQLIDGSPYLNDAFVPGNVLINDSNMYKGVPLRLNVYSNQMEFKHNNGTILILDSSTKFKEIQIENHRFLYHSFNISKRNIAGYFELLSDGKVSLIKKYSIDIKDAEPPKPFKDPEPASYVSKPASFFIIKGNGTYEVSNEKELLEVLLDEQEKLESFIKKNKLKVKREDGLTEAINYYNNL